MGASRTNRKAPQCVTNFGPNNGPWSAAEMDLSLVLYVVGAQYGFNLRDGQHAFG
jgi:hypothetical protein